MNTHLLIIDPQNDFVDPKGTLCIPGAESDMKNIISLIKRIGKHINSIHVTLDNHHLAHIAHPIFWVDKQKNHPEPFTIISLDDMKKGRWTTYNKLAYDRAFDYIKALEDKGRYLLCIWPLHCLIGTWGANVYPKLSNALLDWCSDFKAVNYIVKGTSFWTEHYSAVKAEIPDLSDSSTMLNLNLIRDLRMADNVLIVGEALSHCVINTIKDLQNKDIKNITLLKDCSSSVAGYENISKEAIKKLSAEGVQIAKSTDF